LAAAATLSLPRIFGMPSLIMAKRLANSMVECQTGDRIVNTGAQIRALAYTIITSQIGRLQARGLHNPPLAFVASAHREPTTLYDFRTHL
jgi:hypothetical protein